MTRRIPSRSAALVAGLATLALLPFSSASAQQAAAGCDIDADGFTDAMLPETLPVLGAESGDLTMLAIPGELGFVAVCADFDLDGYDDVVHVDSWTSRRSASGQNETLDQVAVLVVTPGSAGGLDVAASRVIGQGAPDVAGWDVPDTAGLAHTHDSLAVGDFDSDGNPDLVWGIPGSGAGDVRGGMVVMLEGGPDGLAGTGRSWHQDTPGVRGVAERGDDFGAAVAVGDFNGDGHDDLAIGAPHEDHSGHTDSGLVHVLFGSSTGLTAVDDQIWHQGSASVVGAVEYADAFGAVLEAGDLDGDGHDDLAVGVPRETIGEGYHAGAVNVLYGTPTGLDATRDVLLHQDVDGIGGKPEDFDNYGESLAIGDLDGDGHDDLAVGVPREGISANGRVTANYGMTNVLYGSPDGVMTVGSENWSPFDVGYDGPSSSLSSIDLLIADLDDDGHAELVSRIDAREAELYILRGSAAGLTADDNQLFS